MNYRKGYGVVDTTQNLHADLRPFERNRENFDLRDVLSCREIDCLGRELILPDNLFNLIYELVTHRSRELRMFINLCLRQVASKRCLLGVGKQTDTHYIS